MRSTLTLHTAAGPRSIPARWAICPTCRGNGQHSLHLGAITQEEIDQDWSQDEFQDYLDGGYDQRCEACEGSGKVLEADLAAMPKADRIAWEAQQEEDASDRALYEAERRFGC